MHEVTIVYSTESDGALERLCCALFGIVGTMLLGVNEPQNDLLAEAIQTTSFKRNRLMTKICRNHKTPFEVTRYKAPKLDHVRIFGSQACVHERGELRSKNFDSQALTDTLVGNCQRNAY